MNRTWRMTFVGQPMGAVRMTQRSKWVNPRALAYLAYRQRLKVEAMVAGFPDELDPEKSYMLTVAVAWKGRARADLDNVVKGVADSLVRQDRRVLEIRAIAGEHRAGEEQIEIELKER